MKTTKTVKTTKTKGVQFKAYPRPLRIEDIAAAFKRNGYRVARIQKAHDVHSVYLQSNIFNLEMELHIDSPTSPMADDTEPFFFINNMTFADTKGKAHTGTLGTLPIKNYTKQSGRSRPATVFVKNVLREFDRVGFFARIERW